MEDDNLKLLLGGIAVLGAVLAALVAAVANFIATRSTRRRAVYADSVTPVVAWAEMAYRVRRRGANDDEALRDRFHDLQERLACHQALIGSESKYVERSYAQLVRTVKADHREPIREAWARTLPESDAANTGGPDLTDQVAAFTRDVRHHLSPWPWHKVALWWHNRKADA